jgi:hypothetical protein
VPDILVVPYDVAVAPKPEPLLTVAQSSDETLGYVSFVRHAVTTRTDRRVERGGGGGNLNGAMPSSTT